MRCRWFLLALLPLATGCGDSSIVPVSGRITCGGQPLANASVVFSPQSGEKNPGPSSQARTDKDGRFTLQLATGKGSGAVVGKHKVSITAYEGDDGGVVSSGSDMKPFRPELLGDDYNAKTKLTFDVPSGGTDDANFNLPAAKSAARGK
jgi:hypothetical protein